MIAFDAAVDGGNNGGATSSFSFNHTIGSGSDRMIVVDFTGDVSSGVDDITSVMCSGVAMNLAGKNTDPGLTSSRKVYQYWLANPPSGVNLISIACASAHYILAGARSYFGMDSSGPDLVNVLSSGVINLFSPDITPPTPNSWILTTEASYSTSTPPLADSNCVSRAVDGTYGTWGAFDSDGPISTYNNPTIIRTGGSAQYPIGMIASYPPAVAGGGTTNPGYQAPFGWF